MAQKMKGLQSLEVLQQNTSKAAVEMLEPGTLEQAWEAMQEDVKYLKAFLDRAEETAVRIRNAALVVKVHEEQLKQGFNKEYREIKSRYEELKRDMKKSNPVSGGVMIVSLENNQTLNQRLKEVEAGMKAVEKGMGDEIAKKYGFQSFQQARTLVNPISEKGAK